MLDHKLLPPELWLEIFEWAAHNPNLHPLDNAPFQPIPGSIRDPNITVRLSLSLVCRTWRQWIAQSLYRDIKIKYGVNALHDVLDTRIASTGMNYSTYGEMVRRVVLSYQSTVTGPHCSLNSIKCLQLCPYIHTLLRPRHSLLDALCFDYEAERVRLPSLKRLEWWHHNEAERSGGINSLGFLLRNSPNLTYLFVGGVVESSHTCLEPEPIILPALETLRLHVINGLLLRQILFRWSLPCLKDVIMDAPLTEHGMHGMWETFGNQLEKVEFGKHVRFLMSDNLSPCLRGCPNLRQLNYHLFFTVPPKCPQAHTSLTTVGLHAHVNGLLADGSFAWDLLENHFHTLGGAGLPALRNIILYGDWQPILDHPRFSPVRLYLKENGRMLIFADRRVIDLEVC